MAYSIEVKLYFFLLVFQTTEMQPRSMQMQTSL